MTENSVPSIEIQFSEDHDKNERMNRVLEIIGNHPDGINFNSLAELAAVHVSRSTLETWLEEFKNFHVVERNYGRRGQRSTIKPTGNYKKWLGVQENYEISIGYLKSKLDKLKQESDRRKFTATDFYEIYKLQTDMFRLPFDSYLSGLEYSVQVANLLRDGSVNAIKSMFAELSKIITDQCDHYNFSYGNIFENLQVIMEIAPRLQLLSGKNDETGKLRMSINTAHRRLEALLS